MRKHLKAALYAFPLALGAMPSCTASAQVPDAIAAPGETVVATFHAEGAQIYDCKPDAGGKPTWQFREPIATLLADARMRPTLPELNAGRILLNRLWPLLFSTIGAGALAFVLPQVPAVATGFAIIWALAWRRQASAVMAIEERDGARFYIERTSPLQPIKLVRTPGFRSNLFELNGSSGRAHRARPRA